MMLFKNKENLKPATLRKRINSNLIDLLVFLIIVLVFTNNDSLNMTIRTIVILSYPFILIPLFLSLGATPGELLYGIRMRKKSDLSKNINLYQAYLRIVLILFNNTVGFLGFRNKKTALYEDFSDTLSVEINEEVDTDEIKQFRDKQSKFNFAVAAIAYLLWVVWLGNYWFLLGLPIIFDIYITKKVNWAPWKKRDGNNHWLVEWLDALIFAIVAVTLINTFLFQNYKIPTPSMEKSLLVGDHLYVSKVAYGPRIPNTPLSIPFMQHTIPGTTSKSYSELIQWPYKRLAGLSKVRRDDPVVFNFPAGDTVCLDMWEVSYYHIIRSVANQIKMTDQYSMQPLKTDKEYYALGRERVLREHQIVVRPVDKRDNYIKRCVAIPGDTLQIIDGDVYVNGNKQKVIAGLQNVYYINTGGRSINPKKLKQLGIYDTDISHEGGYLRIIMTDEMVEELKKNKMVDTIIKETLKKDYSDIQIFPNDKRYPWNLDQFGPLYIPKKGVTIDLNIDNLPLYERIIGYYEGNDLQVKDSTIYINGAIAKSYTFKMDYYWMMGDNRHNSLDSRYWGFVPEDHIIGKPVFVWLSLNKEKRFPANIRLSRMFMRIK